MDEPSNEQLRHYYAVCLAKGFNPGCDLFLRLFRRTVSQPTLTRSVRYIEDNVDPCIHRGPPFQLLPTGAMMLEYARGIVENFLPNWQRIKQAKQVVHVAAPEFALREYLVALQLRMETHGIHVQFHPRTELEIVEGVAGGTYHLGVTSLTRPRPRTVKSLPLVEVEPVLLLPVGAKDDRWAAIKSAADLWRQGMVPGRLACVDETHSVRMVFDQGLATMKVSWPERRLVVSTAIVTMMVAQGAGPGLSLRLDKLTQHDGVRMIELPGFENVLFGPVWREPLSDAQKKLLKEIKLIAEESRLVPVARRGRDREFGVRSFEFGVEGVR